MIPYGRQDVTQSDIDSVVEVLRSNFLTQGPVGPRFEAAVARMVDCQFGVASNSATSALHVACMALGLGPGKLLWTSPNTYIASANCARYCGADVDFVDIDPETWNMSTAALREKLEAANRDGKLPDIVVPVHFAGQPTDQEEIWQLAQEYGFKVLEDASHSIGAFRNGEAVGSCRWSNVTVFSFHPVKIITSGEGGIALTNDADVAERMSMLRTHGVTRDAEAFSLPPESSASDPKTSSVASDYPAWYYEQQFLGYNYRLTEVHAALGLSQLPRVAPYVERRNELAVRYDEALGRLPLQLPYVASENRSAYHVYVVRLTRDAARHRHREVFDALRRRGIGVNLHYIPVHLQPYYRSLGFSVGQFPEAEHHGRSAITLPLYPRLSHQEQDVVIDALKDIL